MKTIPKIALGVLASLFLAGPQILHYYGTPHAEIRRKSQLNKEIKKGSVTNRYWGLDRDYDCKFDVILRETFQYQENEGSGGTKHIGSDTLTPEDPGFNKLDSLLRDH